MLQNLRDKATSWIATTIIVLIILSFAFWGVDRLFVGGSAEQYVAKVNGNKISQPEFVMAYNRLKRQEQINLGPAFFNQPHLAAQLKQSVLHDLVNTSASLQAAQKAGFYIGSAIIDSNLATIPLFQDNGRFSPQRFQQVISAMGFTPEQFMQDLQNRLLLQQVQLGITNTAFLLPDEIKSAENFYNQQRQFSYALIDANQFNGKVQISDAQIQAYYQQHQDDFKMPAQISINYIQLSLADIQKQIQPSDAELNRFYQENKDRFQSQPFAAVKNNVRQAYVQETAQKQFQQATSHLTDLSYQYPGSLEPLAKQMHLPVQSSDFFTRAGAAQGAGKYPQVVTAAFAGEVLHQHLNSNVINLPDNSVMVLSIKAYQPAKVKALEEVKPAIVIQLKQTQAAQLAADQAQAASQALQQGKSIQDVTQQFGLSWQDSGMVTRSNKTMDATILQAAFTLPVPGKQASVTQVSLAKKPGSYAVVDLKQVEAGPNTLTPPQQTDYLAMLTQSTGQADYLVYQQAILSEAKISYYEKTIQAN